ncbi:helix-turn-helix transcriptional regulator [Bacillus cereus]|nr:helix-turn-helix transcriptional regulator [Bacillus cereus]
MNNRVREVRLSLGMSLTELARRANLSRVAVTNIENGNGNPTVKSIILICEVLKQNPSEIFFTDFVIHELQKEGGK